MVISTLFRPYVFVLVIILLVVRHFLPQAVNLIPLQSVVDRIQAAAASSGAENKRNWVDYVGLFVPSETSSGSLVYTYIGFGRNERWLIRASNTLDSRNKLGPTEVTSIAHNQRENISDFRRRHCSIRS